MRSSKKTRSPSPAATQPEQLSLFSTDPKDVETATSRQVTSVLDLVRARFEHGPEMTQDDYKRWVKILVLSSIKRMESK